MISGDKDNFKYRQAKVDATTRLLASMRQEVQKMVESTAKSQYEERLRQHQEALAMVEADTTMHEAARARKVRMLRGQIKQLQKWVDSGK